jgi:hypothetical protein
MLDEALEIGSNFDWISPLFAFVQDFINRPVSDFGISVSAGWGRRDIKRLLKQHGVGVWGVIYRQDMLMFTVRKAQAKRAFYLLKRARVPIRYAPAGLASAVQREMERQANAGTPLDPTFDFLDRLDDGRF